MALQQQVEQAFQDRFGTSPSIVVRAPGRVNLIGEHTDYNDGFVLPMAINRAVWVALRPRTDGYVVLHSVDYEQTAEFSLSEMIRRHDSWAEYVKGVAWALQEAGHRLTGFDGVVIGDVPRGAGLSSSAAIELAAARAFAHVNGIAWDAPTMAKLCQKAENQWVGVNSGIMDQMISAAGEAGHALLIDCRTLETTSSPLPPNTAVVVMDTATRRQLVTSAYNERRAQCEAAAQHFGVPALRDVTLDQLKNARAELDDVVFRRAHHVITENARTLAAADAMKQGDAAKLGRLMIESHLSMRDDFEITNPQLNMMQQIALSTDGCIGARMTGGGFGGCAVALVSTDAIDAFVDSVASRYATATDLTPALYVCEASAGAEVVKG